MYTETAQKIHTIFFCTQKLYPEQFLHSRNSSAQKPLRTDTNRCFLNAQQLLETDGFYTESSPQKSYAQKILRTTVFYIQTLLYTYAIHMPLHGRRIAHRNLCTQHTFARNQFLDREVLLPLLDHLPFVFPLSSGDLTKNGDITDKTLDLIIKHGGRTEVYWGYID